MKLYKYGIRGLAFDWFKNYLTNRKQFVKINESVSTYRNIVCGVPQGSTLGPLLFLLYINDLPNVSTRLSFRIFADDTNIFYSHTDPNTIEKVMNEDLELIMEYCTLNKLSINMKKTHYMIISSSRKKNIIININHFEQKDYIKYLGVYLDKNLNWDHHISCIHNKVAKNTGIIYLLRHYIGLKTLVSVYYSLIYPYLSYAIHSWGTAYKSKLTKLNTIQNKCARSIFFAHNREHAAPYYNLLELLTLENIFKLKIAIFVFQIIHNQTKIPEIFLDIVKLAKVQHKYNTRYAAKYNLTRPAVKTNYGKSTFKYTASVIWENIPPQLKDLSYTQFKIQLKRHLILSQK